MLKGLAHFIRKTFGLRKELSISFYVLDILFRKILRQNAKVRWAVHHTATIHTPERLKVGKGAFPGDSPGVFIDAYNGIEIGDYTNIGPNVGIVSSNHDHFKNEVMLPAPPIKIGKCCWLGMGSVILPGVELGDYTIVGAGAIVNKSFKEGYCVIGGNPARILKHLDKEKVILADA